MEETKSEILLSRADVLSIPESLMPLPVLSDSLRGFFSWGIKVHEKGCYNHFMWMIKPGVFASQGLTFAKDKVESYFNGYRLKIWNNPMWTRADREAVRGYLNCALSLPWYKRIYDPVQIVGKAIYCDWLQIPGLNICSDTASCLKIVEKDYDLVHPDPEEVNAWLTKAPGWQVLGRYVPD